MLKIGSSFAKIIATFIVSLVLIVCTFAFFPKGVLWAQDLSELMSDHLRDLPILGDQAKILFRLFTEGGVMLGIMTTIISRIIVEFIAMPFGSRN